METSAERTRIRSKRIAAIEARFGEPIEQTLIRLHYTEGRPLAEIAKKLRVPAGTLPGWMIRLGINQRAFAEKAAKELAS